MNKQREINQLATLNLIAQSKQKSSYRDKNNNCNRTNYVSNSFHNLPKFNLSLVTSTHPERAVIEKFIKVNNQKNIKVFAIILVIKSVVNDQIVGAVGLRYADKEKLELEHQLEQSIESMIVFVAGKTIKRKQLIELGHMTVCHPDYNYTVVKLVAKFINQLDVKWLVALLPEVMKPLFQQLNIEFKAVAGLKTPIFSAENEQAGFVTHCYAQLKTKKD